MNHKKNYTKPLTDDIPICPEVNFCVSNRNVSMNEILFDDLEDETLNW